MTEQTVGLRMKWIVEHLFESKLEACFRLSVASPGQLNKYYANEVHPSAKVLMSAVRIGISADWILTGYGHLWTNTLEGQNIRRRLEESVRSGKLSMTDIPEGSRFNQPDVNPNAEKSIERASSSSLEESGNSSVEHPERKSVKTTRVKKSHDQG